MERLWPRTYEEQIQYHLDDGRAPEFDKGQPGRIDLARFCLDKILARALTYRPLKLVELGCGAGDITGPYAMPEAWGKHRVEVHGYDVVPMAQETCARRWPFMEFHLGPVEEAEPQDCDLLVLCEFLEHVDDPQAIIKKWLPKAKWVIIGHPLYEPNPPYETGHIWSYTLEDWWAWFTDNDYTIIEQFRFPMAPYTDMVLGYGVRTDLVAQ